MLVLPLLLLLTAQAATPHVHVESSHHPEICSGHVDGSDPHHPGARSQACSACSTTSRLRMLAARATVELAATFAPLALPVLEPPLLLAESPHAASDSPRAPPLSFS